ncbi:hypothetical protein Fmac_029439 [Flemingia macrophylla]|uniref:DUF6821 domain-containing protein n=1 Tax=Flemingia macrophylla TaxID=520843 RepID=A0ABD1LAC4_9FABA
MMDTNEWIVVSDDEYVHVNEDCDEKPIIIEKINTDLRSVLNMNYFSEKTPETSREYPMSKVVPIQLNPKIGNVPREGSVEENTKDHVESTLVPSPTTNDENKGEILEADHVSMILSKDNKSPKSIGRELFLLSSDIGALKLEDKNEVSEITVSSVIDRDSIFIDCHKEVKDSSSGFNFWKWSLNGVGAICSFGVAAAATICVLQFRNRNQQRNKFQKDQKIRFQIYSDDQRIKQILQHASKLNGAVSVVYGVRLSRARISCGGYCVSL